jgi:hypothetical protein
MNKRSILAIPDIHCQDVLCRVGSSNGLCIGGMLENNLIDEVVFMGDYFDSFYDERVEKSYDNMTRIIELKKKYPQRVRLLVGNHDLHYIYPDVKFRCSGFNEKLYFRLNGLLNDNIKDFDVFYRFNDLVFSHAGFQSSYVDAIESDFRLDFRYIIEHYESLSVYEIPKDVMGYKCPKRNGKSPFGSFEWVDYHTIAAEYVRGENLPYNQIVGHTSTVMPMMTFNQKGRCLIGIDTLGNNPDVIYVFDMYEIRGKVSIKMQTHAMK